MGPQTDLSKAVERIELLKQRGMSQAEISRQSGVPQSTISHWVNGDRKEASYFRIKAIMAIKLPSV